MNEDFFNRVYPLLRHWISDEQRAQFMQHGYFYVVSKDDRVYALYSGMNVIAMENGAPACDYHVFAVDRPGGPLSADDSLTTQLLFLQTNPDALFAQACANGVYHLTGELARGRGCPKMRGRKVRRSLTGRLGR
jgi:hypothetical protein